MHCIGVSVLFSICVANLSLHFQDDSERRGEAIFAQMQGFWVLQSAKEGAADASPGVWRDHKGAEFPSIVVRSHLMRGFPDQHPGVFSPSPQTDWLVIDARHLPARVQIKGINGFNVETTRAGIIQIKNDCLEICVGPFVFGPVGEQNKLSFPKEFDSSKESDSRLEIYRRPNWYSSLQRIVKFGPLLLL
jgi:hypothetical protein